MEKLDLRPRNEQEVLLAVIAGAILLCLAGAAACAAVGAWAAVLSPEGMAGFAVVVLAAARALTSGGHVDSRYRSRRRRATRRRSSWAGG